MGIGMTALVGLCSTFSAGLFSWYVLDRHGAGLILSVAVLDAGRVDLPPVARRGLPAHPEPRDPHPAEPLGGMRVAR
jgi:hypothetical protein